MKNALYNRIQFWSFCLSLVMATACSLAGSVNLKVETDKSTLMAEQKNTAYLRVGLTGFPIEQKQERSPVNISIVLDKSGSMGGDKIEKARSAAIMALDRLNSNDIVSVVLYDTNVQVLVPATKMTDRKMVADKIRQVRADGSTALYAGVQAGAKEVRKFISKEYVSRIVLLSDGLANVGPQSPDELGRLGSALVEEGISVTTIGLGLGYNEDLMSKLAFNSDGGHYFADDPEKLAQVFESELGRAMSVVAQDVTIEIICGEGMRPVRLLGREGNIDDRIVKLDINSVYSEHEKYAILEVEVPAHKAEAEREIANVKVKYLDMQSNETVNVSTVAHITFTDSQEQSQASVNAKVAADAVEQIAILNNKQATALRDAGQIEDARKILGENILYLKSNSSLYNSKKLQEYAYDNIEDSENLDESNWNFQRKTMRENQTMRQQQR